MKKKNVCISLGFVLAFVLWTLLVSFVDLRAIGPKGTYVGFGALNEFVHSLIGYNMTLYTVTDWLGLVPIAVALGFAVLGFCEMVARRSILKVDPTVLALGVFYIIVIAVFIFFENVVINYRPILIDGCLEASYPSSTTLLVMCVMPSAALELNVRIKNRLIGKCVIILISAFTAFMVIGRLFSGVHWVSDIIGGALLSTGLVLMYSEFMDFTRK